MQHKLQLQPHDENLIDKETEARNNFMQAYKAALKAGGKFCKTEVSTALAYSRGFQY